MSSNVKDGVLFASPQTSGERVETAEICVVKLAIKMPALVDGIDNRVERAYTGWPDRLYVDRHRRAGSIQERAPWGSGLRRCEIQRDLCCLIIVDDPQHCSTGCDGNVKAVIELTGA